MSTGSKTMMLALLARFDPKKSRQYRRAPQKTRSQYCSDDRTLRQKYLLQWVSEYGGVSKTYPACTLRYCKRRYAILGLVTLMLSACWMKQETGKQMQAEIIALQTEFEEIRKAHSKAKSELRQRLDEADRRATELNLIINEYKRVTGRNAADFGVEIEQIKRLVAEMRGVGEVNEHRLGVIENRLSIIHDNLSTQKANAKKREEDKLANELDQERLRRDKEKKKLSDIRRPENQEDFYKLAYNLVEAKQYRAGRILFEEFIQKWPTGAYSDNALYWIGESHYAEGDFRKAAFAFQKVRKQFPKSDKAADALLKLGYCFYSLKMYRESLPFLKQFVKTYPKNRMAKKARRKMREAQKKIK